MMTMDVQRLRNDLFQWNMTHLPERPEKGRYRFQYSGTECLNCGHRSELRTSVRYQWYILPVLFGWSMSEKDIRIPIIWFLAFTIRHCCLSCSLLAISSPVFLMWQAIRSPWLFFSVYLVQAVRNFYGQGLFKTIVKYIFLNTIFFILALFATLILGYGQHFRILIKAH